MSLQALLESPIIVRLGWTLLHSLWQGAAVCILALIVLRFLRHRSAAARYTTAFAGLFLMAALPLATFMWLPATPRTLSSLSPTEGVALAPVAPQSPGNPAAQVPVTNTGTCLVRTPQPSPSASPPPVPPQITSVWGLNQHQVERLLSYAVAAWLASVLLLSSWRLAGWLLLQRLRVVGTSPAPSAMSTAVCTSSAG
jgi:hypothetical protein